MVVCCFCHMHFSLSLFLSLSLQLPLFRGASMSPIALFYYQCSKVLVYLSACLSVAFCCRCLCACFSLSFWISTHREKWFFLANSIYALPQCCSKLLTTALLLLVPAPGIWFWFILFYNVLFCRFFVLFICRSLCIPAMRVVFVLCLFLLC